MSGVAAVQPVPRRLVILLAVACGASVANLYYAQPLLHTIAVDLGVSPAATALVITASQIGYTAGLVLIVPLGDLLNRRRLVTSMLLVAAAGLAAAAAAPGLPALAAALLLVGVTSVVAQILVPFASSLAGPAQRGRVVGQVMSGLLVGILLARTFSGLVAQAGGWRLVYAVAAAGMVALAFMLRGWLPDVPAARGSLRYGRLLRSVLRLVAEEPILRRRMVFGALGMAGFTVIWTSLALLLSRPPYSFDEGVIGLFGLAGVAGAVAAQAAGRAADRGGGHAATGLFLGAIIVGWGLLAFGRSSIVALIAGIVLLDLGVQGQHIVNQTIIYGLRPDAGSRLTTAYMTGNFLAAAVASAATALAWGEGGWPAVCGLGGALALTAAAVWLVGSRGAVTAPRERRASRVGSVSSH